MDFTSCFNGMFGKLAHGMCRLTMNGRIAVKTSNGYKSYNVNTGKLTNCSNFVFDIGDDFFFDRVINRALASCDSRNGKAFLCQRFGIAAAEQTKSDNENFMMFLQFHVRFLLVL